MSISSVTSSLASTLFSRLDTKNQGYIEKSDLETAFGNISSTSSDSGTSVDDLFTTLDSDSDGKVTESELTKKLNSLAEELDNQLNSLRMSQAMGGMGGMPPALPSNDEGFSKDELESQLSEIGDSDSTRSSFISNVVNNFDKADADGNGKVTFAEAQSYNQSSDSTSSASSTSSSSTGTSSIAGNMPPPPPPSDGEGFSLDELTSQLSEIGESDSTRSSFISNVVNNFDEADTNGDGKVSFAEAQAINQSSDTTASASSSSTGSASNSLDLEEFSVMLKIMQLAQSYGVWGENGSSSSTSVSTSA